MSASPSSAEVVERLAAFNTGREPERLALKYRTMRGDPFAFLRGTAHLFHEDWPGGTPLDAAPLGWMCGDLHLENFGTFKGDNGLAYFDQNDFDEGALAPATRDLARFLCSLHLAGQRLGADREESAGLARAFLAAYRVTLLDGRPRWVERATARGMVRRLLQGVRNRTRSQLLAERTEEVRGRRRLRIEKGRALPADEAALEAVSDCLAGVLAESMAPRYYQVLDLVRRVSGTGSLGLGRYVALVRGSGDGKKRRGMVLLEIKEARPSVLAAHLQGVPQPAWKSEGDRVVAIQRRVQAVAPALLRPVRMERRSWVLRELQPVKDRLALAAVRGRIKPLRGAIETMAQTVAWAHLRSGGRQGSAIADEWIAFAERGAMGTELLAYARQYAIIVQRDWQAFGKAYDRGAFSVG